MVEQHSERCSALRKASERRGVTEHFGERHVAVDSLHAVFEFHAADGTATGVEVAHHVADILVGNVDFDLHNGFEQYGRGFFRSGAERH